LWGLKPKLAPEANSAPHSSKVLAGYSAYQLRLFYDVLYFNEQYSARFLARFFEMEAGHT
jgi:hypothetical protein